MINNSKLRIALGLLAVNSLAGCSTSPWHGNLMSNDQLVSANCQQLAVEEQRVADNAKHTAEVSSSGGIGTVILAVLEGMASVATGTPIDTNNSATMSFAGMNDEHSKQAAQFESRKNMITMLRSKKGCP